MKCAIQFLVIASIFLSQAYGNNSKGELPWSEEDESWYQSLPSYSVGLAKLLPWTENAHASSVNIRNELLQNGQIMIDGLLTSNIKQQNQCGSCVTNAIVTAMEYRVKRELLLNKEWPFSNYTILLSVPQALGCSGQSCNGTTRKKQMEKLVENEYQIVLQEDNNTVQDTGAIYNCISSPDYVKLKSFAKADEAAAKHALLNHFAVTASISVGDRKLCSSDLYDYEPGLFEGTDHSITIIGFDDNDNGGVWLVQDSWGETCHTEGDDGIIKIKYGKAGISKFLVVLDVEISKGLEQRMLNPWCLGQNNGLVQTVNGYNSQTSYTISKNNSYWFGSNGSPIIRKLSPSNYYGLQL